MTTYQAEAQGHGLRGSRDRHSGRASESIRFGTVTPPFLGDFVNLTASGFFAWAWGGGVRFLKKTQPLSVGQK